MRKNKLTCLLLTIMISGATAVTFLPVQAEQSSEGDITGVYQASIATIAQGDNVTFQYPVLTGIDGYDQAVVDQINQYFYSDASESLIANWEEVQGNAEAVRAVDPELAGRLTYHVTCDTLYVDGDRFSIMQFHSTYLGGAHGYAFPVGTSFDLKTGEKMTLGMLLDCDEATAQAAAVESFREDYIGKVENITEESIRENIDRMQYWMQPEGLYVNFAPYELASYAVGQIRALVTPEILAQIQEAGNSDGTSVSGSGDEEGFESQPEMIAVIRGIQAPASDFVLPFSSQRVLTDADLTVLDGDTVEEDHYWSQLAINEILARYGYQFNPEQGGAAKEAYDQFEGKDWYEQAKVYCPSSSASEMLYHHITSLELSNIDFICEWQKMHDCYY